jgi:hypothetical protein
LALSACDNPWLEDAPSLETVLSTGWLFGDRKEAAVPPTIVQPVYCYETIGVGDCHEQPLEDGGNRLVGFEGPTPFNDPLPTTP